MCWGFSLVQQAACLCWCSSCMPQTLMQTRDSAQRRCCITWFTLILTTSEVVVRLGSCGCWSRCESIATRYVKWSELPLQLKMDAGLLKVRQTTYQVSHCWKCGDFGILLINCKEHGDCPYREHVVSKYIFLFQSNADNWTAWSVGKFGNVGSELFEWKVWNLCLQTFLGFMWKDYKLGFQTFSLRICWEAVQHK